MPNPTNTKTDVLITGAGPSGLVLALWLTQQGIRVRIVDKQAITPSTSRALAIHARTLELYRQLGVAETLMANGHAVQATNVWTEGVHRGRIPFGDAGRGLTPYPFIQVCAQDRHEEVLQERLRELGVCVERGCEVVGFEQDGEGVRVQLRGGNGDGDGNGGEITTCEAAFIAGCDGAHSTVRRETGVGFTGDTYPQLFFVADIEGSGPILNSEANLTFCQSELALTFPFDDGHRARLTGAVDEAAIAKQANSDSELTLDDVAAQTIKTMNLQIDRVNWLTTYRIHHRVAESFRHQRAFLVGDAAHIHSPVGGQGMNTGIGDAVNLAWKLAAVLKGTTTMASPSLLDSYDAERGAFARTLVDSTDRAFNTIVSKGLVGRFVRSWFFPYVAPFLAQFEMVRYRAFSGVSQVLVNYRHGPLSAGSAGTVQGGDRVPWAPVEGRDNFDSLREITWQVHVYGAVREHLVEWCRARGFPLHVFAWQDKYGEVGLGQDAAYLIRPDTYIAVAEPEADAQSFEEYFRGVGIAYEPVNQLTS